MKAPEHRAQVRDFMEGMLEHLNMQSADSDYEFVRIGNVITKKPKDADPEAFAKQYREYFEHTFPYLATPESGEEEGEA